MHALFLIAALFVSSFASAQNNTTLPSNDLLPSNSSAPLAGPSDNNTTAPIPAPKQRNEAPPTTQTGACAKSCVRREFRALSEPERAAYFNAVRTLMNTPASSENGAGPRLVRRQADQRLNGPSEYDRLVKLHIDAQKFSHGSPYFLPWHRAYLLEFERALQRVDPSVCLTYWSWALDSQSPEESIVFSPEYLGGNGVGNDGCVQDGKFAGWRPAYPEPHCFSRQYTNGDSLGSFYSIEAVNRAVSTIKDYDQFRRHVEGVLHPAPHNNIGGDMSTMGSPNDPLFWMHHAYVDYIWTGWQKRNGFAFNADPNTPFEALTSYSGSSVLDARQLCYEYADLREKELGDIEVVPTRPTPPKTPSPGPSKDKLPELTKVIPLPQEDDNARYNPKDRSNLVIIRYVAPLKEDWCRMNNLDVQEVRKYEDDYRGVIKGLNDIKGYVSPCSLLKRPKLCASLIKKKKVTNFYVDVENVGRVEVGYNQEVAAQDPYKAIANVNQRVYACSPSVERPAEEIRASVRSLTGPSAFEGAGSLTQITDPDQLRHGTAAKQAAGVFVSLMSLVAGAVVLA